MWRLPINHSRETTLALPFELTVGLRYTRAGRRGRRKDGFMSFISGISVASIAVGVMALIIVLSVMNGFQKEVRDRMLSVLSHAEIYNLAGGVGDWNQALAAFKEADKRIVAGAPFVSGQALLSAGSSVQGAVVRGIDPAKSSWRRQTGTRPRGSAAIDKDPDIKYNPLENAEKNRSKHYRPAQRDPVWLKGGEAVC